MYTAARSLAAAHVALCQPSVTPCRDGSSGQRRPMGSTCSNHMYVVAQVAVAVVAVVCGGSGGHSNSCRQWQAATSSSGSSAGNGGISSDVDGTRGRSIMRGGRTWGATALVAIAAAIATVATGGGAAATATPFAAVVVGRQAALPLGGGGGSRDLRRTATEDAAPTAASLPAFHVDASVSWPPRRHVPPHPWSACELTTVDAVAAALTRTVELSMLNRKGSGGDDGDGGGMPCAARYFAPLLAPLSWMASRSPSGHVCIPNAYFEALGWHGANYATAAASRKTPRLLAMDVAAPGGCAMSARLIQALHQEKAAWACAYDDGGDGENRQAVGDARRRWVPRFRLCTSSVEVRVRMIPHWVMERARWRACQLRSGRGSGSGGVGGRGGNGGALGGREPRGVRLLARTRQAAPAVTVSLGIQPPAPLFMTGQLPPVASAARQGTDVVIGNGNIDGGGGTLRHGNALPTAVTPPRGPAEGDFRQTQASTDVQLSASGGGGRRDQQPGPPRHAVTAAMVGGDSSVAPSPPRRQRICRVCPPEYVGVSAAWCCARYCRAFAVGLDIAVSSRMATRTGCCEKLVKACVQLK